MVGYLHIIYVTEADIADSKVTGLSDSMYFYPEYVDADGTELE